MRTVGIPCGNQGFFLATVKLQKTLSFIFFNRKLISSDNSRVERRAYLEKIGQIQFKFWPAQHEVQIEVLTPSFVITTNVILFLLTGVSIIVTSLPSTLGDLNRVYFLPYLMND